MSRLRCPACGAVASVGLLLPACAPRAGRDLHRRSGRAPTAARAATRLQDHRARPTRGRRRRHRLDQGGTYDGAGSDRRHEAERDVHRAEPGKVAIAIERHDRRRGDVPARRQHGLAGKRHHLRGLVINVPADGGPAVSSRRPGTTVARLDRPAHRERDTPVRGRGRRPGAASRDGTNEIKTFVVCCRPRAAAGDLRRRSRRHAVVAGPRRTRDRRQRGARGRPSCFAGQRPDAATPGPNRIVRCTVAGAKRATNARCGRHGRQRASTPKAAVIDSSALTGSGSGAVIAA